MPYFGDLSIKSTISGQRMQHAAFLFSCLASALQLRSTYKVYFSYPTAQKSVNEKIRKTLGINGRVFYLILFLLLLSSGAQNKVKR